MRLPSNLGLQPTTADGLMGRHGIGTNRIALADRPWIAYGFRKLRWKSDVLDLTTLYLLRFLSRPENVWIVAVDDGVPVGYLLAYLLDRVDRDQQMMFFYEIGVAESHRRRGVGKRLIGELKSICREADVMKMWVPTGRSNVAATRLYTSTGAVPATERGRGDIHIPS